MNLNLKTALFLVLGSAALAGCGTGPAAIKGDNDSLKRATEMREFYTKSGGNYDSLSAEEKAKFQKDIAPGLAPEKAWQSLAPQKADMSGPTGDPRTRG